MKETSNKTLYVNINYWPELRNSQVKFYQPVPCVLIQMHLQYF